MLSLSYDQAYVEGRLRERRAAAQCYRTARRLSRAAGSRPVRNTPTARGVAATVGRAAWSN